VTAPDSLLPGANQYREDVVALLEVAGGAALSHLGEKRLIQFGPATDEIRSGLEGAEVAAHPRYQRQRVVALRQDSMDELLDAFQLGALIQAEDHPEDDLQRQRLHVAKQRGWLAGGYLAPSRWVR